jgi:hypothetical protein
LGDFGASAASGGPLSDQPGIFWIELPDAMLEEAVSRLPRLGYTESAHWLEPTTPRARHGIQWRGKTYQLTPLYCEDPDEAREQAPDRRVFLLATPDGEGRLVRGYRGDGQALSRRGLPVYDARLLANLAMPSGISAKSRVVFLDPFAGIGGVVLEAKAHGCHVFSLDRDPALRLGLAHFGAAHVVADARNLPYADNAMDAIATEPPYDDQAILMVVESLVEMARILKPAGSMVLLCAEAQAAALRQQAAQLPLELWLDETVDRKGLGCVLLAWHKLAVGR